MIEPLDGSKGLVVGGHRHIVHLSEDADLPYNGDVAVNLYSFGGHLDAFPIGVDVIPSGELIMALCGILGSRHGHGDLADVELVDFILVNLYDAAIGHLVSGGVAPTGGDLIDSDRVFIGRVSGGF